MRVERAVEIVAPPGKVFEVIVDPSTHRKWRPTCHEFRTENGLPIRLGSRLIESVRFLRRHYQTTYVVTELEPARVFSVRSIEGPIPLALRCELARTPRGTRLTFVLEVDAPPLTKAILALYLRDEARRLRRLVETRHDHASPPRDARGA